MKTIFTANRLKEPCVGYTVLVRASGIGSVDLSIWLDDEDAHNLAAQLALAATPVTPAPATEAA